ncbi:phosphorylase [Alcaligenaceae bacterium]|nr:phosphorylase [Alcaligenaceae bacterium]
MTTAFMKAVDERAADALASGALQPIQAEQVEIIDGGLPFIVRWLSSLAAKDVAKPAMPGGPRDPDFNPFLSPEPALTVGPFGDHHVAILNKFPVCDRHLVLARREFAEQRQPLAYEDFWVLASLLSESGGLGFYNGGGPAGASQRHKHVQWLPAAPGNASLDPLIAHLSADAPESALEEHAVLPVRHVFARVLAQRSADVDASAASMSGAYGRACAKLGLEPDEEGLMPPCNMLVQNGWMLLVPRKQEHSHNVSVNALAFAGALYVKHPEHVAPIRKAGPLAVLAEASWER